MKTLSLCVSDNPEETAYVTPHNFLLNSNDSNPYRQSVCVCVCETERERERLGLLKSYTKLTYYTKLGRPTSLLLDQFCPGAIRTLPTTH